MNYSRALLCGVCSLSVLPFLTISASAEGAKPAWAAEAKMNPDYVKADAPAAAAPAAEAAPVQTAQATTSYFGGSLPTKDAPFSAEAKMNPDYKSDKPAASAAPATPAPAPAASAAAPASKPAWAADAKMNPDYVPGPGPAASTTPPPAATVSVGHTLDKCRADIAAEVQAAKLQFASGSHSIGQTAWGAASKIASIVKACGSEVKIEVGGFTDTVGTAEANKALSELRAKYVADFLVKAGIDPGKISAVGYGWSKPIGSNETPEGRQANRRIEITLSNR